MKLAHFLLNKNYLKTRCGAADLFEWGQHLKAVYRSSMAPTPNKYIKNGKNTIKSPIRIWAPETGAGTDTPPCD